MTELKPCPFCGSNSIVNNVFNTYYACLECGATGPERETLEQAIDAWNKRN